MAASLDGLIRHLVDQIALCGEHGQSIRFASASLFELSYALHLLILLLHFNHCAIMPVDIPLFFYSFRFLEPGVIAKLSSGLGCVHRQACAG